jgi:hypothetical protein
MEKAKTKESSRKREDEVAGSPISYEFCQKLRQQSESRVASTALYYSDSEAARFRSHPETGVVPNESTLNHDLANLNDRHSPQDGGIFGALCCLSSWLETKASETDSPRMNPFCSPFVRLHANRFWISFLGFRANPSLQGTYLTMCGCEQPNSRKCHIRSRLGFARDIDSSSNASPFENPSEIAEHTGR